MKKTSKITSLVMCILMFLTFSVNADGYDILFADMHSASIEMSAQFKCENLDFINEIPGIEDAESLLDGELFIGSLFETTMDFKMDYSVNEDLTDIDFALMMGMDVPLKMNNNLIVDAHIKLGVWGMYDVTDADNPVARIIFAAPVSSKYIVVDIVEEMSLDGREMNTISDTLKKIISKEKFVDFMSAYKDIYKNNSTLAQNGKKTIVTVSDEQFKELTKQLTDKMEELFKDIVPEYEAIYFEASEEEIKEYEDMFSASTRMEFTTGRNNVVDECTASTKMTFNIPNEDEEPVNLSIETVEFSKYSNVNQNVAVAFPALTDENSLYHYEMNDYNYESGYDYVYTYAEYMPATENTVYVPLNSFVTELRGKDSEYSLSVRNGTITLSDLSDCEAFDTVKFTANSPVYTVDSNVYTAPNPIVIAEDGIYVDNTVINNVFAMHMNYAETDLLTNITDASFGRDVLAEEDEEYYEDEYEDEYYEEYDEDYYNCEHYQFLWFEMTYGGEPANEYFALRDVIDGYVYANDNGQSFDIAYDNGVVTITETSGTDTLQSATVTVGSSAVVVNGAEYKSDLPAINYGGKVYVDQKTIQALLGFEIMEIRLIYELSEDENPVIEKTVKSAGFRRKNPKCTHENAVDEYYYG